MDINGAAAIVTGGASGLGAATVKALAAAGADVTIFDLQDDRAEALVAEVGGATRYVRTDVTSVDQVAEGVALAAEAAPLRVAVNCAGIGSADRTIDREGRPAPLDTFRKVIEINLLGTFNVLSQAAAAMAKTAPLDYDERGVIVNTASVAAFEGQVGQTAYSASKGGVVGLTIPAARDLARSGIRVCTIAPGIIDTPLLGSLNDEFRAALAASVPFPQRLGTPEDYASLVMEIVRNGYLNGEVIRLDGALRMQPR